MSESAIANSLSSQRWTRFDPSSCDVPPGSSGVLLINLKAVRSNYRKIRAMAPAAETAAVIKADAYGLGALELVPVLAEEGCRTFFVATLKEAEAVRKLSNSFNIYVLNGLLPGSEEAFEASHVRPVLGSFDDLCRWSSFSRKQCQPLPAAVHVDTGMSRLGFGQGDIEASKSRPELMADMNISLLMSHLACADDPHHPQNQKQLREFEAISSDVFPGLRRSLANSAGIFLGDPFHFDVTRPGISLYGGCAQKSDINPMEPVVWLYGRIAQVRWVERGETVGYGGTQTLKRRTRLVTVSIGYADGFFRNLSASDLREGPAGYVERYRLPLLGRVSMDLTTFDATDVPEHLVQLGGWIELLGEQVKVDDLATFAGTIGYEVLTALGRRYQRIYIYD